MFQLIEAPPRSGKTYFTVNYLCKFTKYDALYNEYILDSDTLIISNIEGLKIRHWIYPDCLKEMTMQEFFTIANFEAIMEKQRVSRVIIALDEVHDIFPAGFKNPEIYSFFAYHGHIGLDVIFMTQGLEMTSRMFNPLLEYIVKVTPRSRSVLNVFSYNYVSKTGHYLFSKSLRKKPLVFGAYKSFRKDEHQKPKNAVKHWVIISAVFFIGAVFVFKSALAIIKGKAQHGEKAAIASRTKQPLNAPVSVPAPVPVASAAAALPPVVPPVSLPPVPLPVPVAVVSEPVKSIRVTGRSESGTDNYYLLSDGRTFKSKKRWGLGEVYNN